jgi:prepilin-type N-terminal cleavage/methylation domain-containing protein
MFGRRLRSHGYGLIEVLVTLGILAIGVNGLVTLQGWLLRQSADSRARVEALQQLRSRLELLRNLSRQAEDAAAFQLLYATAAGAAAGQETRGSTAVFTQHEQVLEVALGRELRVELRWFSADGSEQAVELASILSFVAPQRVAGLWVPQEQGQEAE